MNSFLSICSHLDVLDHLYEGVYFLDREKKVVYWNQGAEQITGYSKTEVLEQPCCTNILQHIDANGESMCETACPVTATLTDGIVREAGVFFLHKEGHRVPVSVRILPLLDDLGEIVGAAELFLGQSSKDTLIAELNALRDAAAIDMLTGQKNRRFGELLITSQLSLLQADNPPFGLLFMDIDKFKDVNDKYGHEVGDQVLRMVANTVSNSIRTQDIMVRWGGEEFIVILLGSSDSTILKKIADKIRVLVEESSLTIDGNLIKVTISIGATIALKMDTVDSLVKRSDQLMYQSKSIGRNRVTVG